ncbi:Protein kinase superfamily protein [Rhynchospora pubera]|uniref:Protein kinase superfamily protein n=1 Tax=Rhynchospora pubera TaxID=906938 RepID=A0AAV8CWZ1_9POAL|nr:Protein kinase superfamily protein [Rhynchospora pubera]KAJ4811701.1 Protein kinase superfamily protein [Rhynchospora pubera]
MKPYFLVLLLLGLIITHGNSQSPASPEGFNCSTNRSIYPCQAYGLYWAGLDQGAQDLISVGDLFGVSRLMVARSSNLTTSTTPGLGEPLLIPFTCDCLPSYNRSYYPVAYQIEAGNTYYLVSTKKFQNLTQYPAVEIVNPTLVPTDLDIGVMVTFPLFCQCPRSTDNFTNLVTYVMQPSDSYNSVAANFGTTVQSLVSLNGAENKSASFATIVVPLVQNPPPIILNSKSEQSTAPAPSPTPLIVSEKNDRNGVIVGLSVALGIVGALCIFMLVLLVCAWRSRERMSEEDGGKGSNAAAARFGRTGSGVKLMTDITEWLDKYKVFKLEELKEATGNFDSSHLIQGTVYKGIIDGETFAVKKMKWNACEELKILQKVNHTNLVKLEGFCIDSESGTCYLVYEYLENGSLDTWLHDLTSSRNLDWRTRLRIALDLAHGLQYIHEHTWPRVVHKDIKSSNVLLDSRLHAKIANFGLAKTGHNAVTTHIIGTQGYIAPEYLADGLVTTKMDVFAYGVVLLELLSGKEAVNAEGDALWAEAEKTIFNFRDGRKEAKIREWMDPALVEQSCPVDSVASVVNVAKACLQKDPAKRPSMVEVAYTLSKADETFADYSGESLSSVGDSDVFAR